MKVVIDIPNFAWIEDIEDFKSAVKEYDKGSAFDHAIREALLLGKPLPISERYKPIILQEHDAEPRTMKAILDTATDEIYICRLTRQDAKLLGIIIEERNDEEV